MLIYATTNTAKLKMMSEFLSPVGISICGLGKIMPEVNEHGKIPLDNARAKALEYYKILKKPLFSCDSGLYIEQLPLDLQPGTNVRVLGGKRLNDDEMIEYYSSLAKKYGRLTARYKNAICLILGDDEVYEYDGDDLSGEKFIISETPHRKRQKGYPIDSLSINIESQKYYYDLSEDKKGFSMETGFQSFFSLHLSRLEKLGLV